MSALKGKQRNFSVVDLGGANSDDRRILLFVFFDGDQFDGYMRFSNPIPSP